jgi:hypothetical protein
MRYSCTVFSVSMFVLLVLELRACLEVHAHDWATVDMVIYPGSALGAQRRFAAGAPVSSTTSDFFNLTPDHTHSSPLQAFYKIMLKTRNLICQISIIELDLSAMNTDTFVSIIPRPSCSDIALILGTILSFKKFQGASQSS